MKQVWVKSATCARTASTTRGAALPIVVTAMPEPRSMKRLPSTSSTIPPPARAANTGMVFPTPRETAAARRLVSSSDAGPGISVTRWRLCSTAGTSAAYPRRAPATSPRKHWPGGGGPGPTAGTHSSSGPNTGRGRSSAVSAPGPAAGNIPRRIPPLAGVAVQRLRRTHGRRRNRHRRHRHQRHRGDRCQTANELPHLQTSRQSQCQGAPTLDRRSSRPSKGADRLAAEVGAFDAPDTQGRSPRPAPAGRRLRARPSPAAPPESQSW